DDEQAGGQRRGEHEDDQLDQVAGGALVEQAHRTDTSAPRVIGPSRSGPRSPTASGVVARPGASRLLSTADSAGLPAYPRPAARKPGATREVPLPVGSSMPSRKSGWWRTGLSWLQGGLGR